MAKNVSSGNSNIWTNYIDQEWLDRRQESVLEPELKIIDPHHHLWDLPRLHYPVSEFLKDLAAGHNVVTSVYLESLAYYRMSGPEHLRPVGETEYVTAAAESIKPSEPAVAAGIVGQADLARGAAVQEVLEAHIEAGKGRFKGVRANLFWDENINFGYPGPPKGIMYDKNFREGLARLSPLGLVCDVMAFHTNLLDVAELAKSFPTTIFIIDHYGAPLGLGKYAQQPNDVFNHWRFAIKQLAKLPNVNIKLGGLGGPFFGALLPLKLRERSVPVSSTDLAAACERYFTVALQAFGSARCMFESNFPADKYDCSYTVLWNANKRLAMDCSPTEKHNLFYGTASRVYSLA